MRYTQPQGGPLQVDSSHPSAKGLFAAYDFAVSTTNLVDNKPLVLGSTVVKATGQKGIGVGGNGVAAGLIFPDYSALVSATGEATILAVLQNGTTADQGLWMIGSQSNVQASHYPFGGLIYLSDFMGVADARWVGGVAPVVPLNQAQVFSAQFKNGQQRAAQNGRTLATNTLAQSAQFPNGSRLNLSSATSSAFTYSGQFAAVFIWNRYVPDAELAALAANPWRLIKSSQRGMLAAAVAATYSYTASGGFTLSGTASTVRSAVKTASGGMTLSGAAIQSRGAVRSAAGGIQLSGTASIAKGRAITASGGLSISGAASILRGVARSTAGGLQLAGASSVTFFSAVQSRVVTPVGGIIISGTAAVVRTCTRLVSGGIKFGGTSPVEFFSILSTGASDWIGYIRRRGRR